MGSAVANEFSGMGISATQYTANGPSVGMSDMGAMLIYLGDHEVGLLNTVEAKWLGPRREGLYTISGPVLV